MSDSKHFFLDSTELHMAYAHCREEIKEMTTAASSNTDLFLAFSEGYMHAKSKFTDSKTTWAVSGK